jgi:rhodanese-related sulfurtransferase
MRSCGLWVGVMVWVSGGCAAHSTHVQPVKDAQQMRSMIDAGGVTVVHALDAEHYARGHIPGAVNIDYEKMARDQLPADKEAALVFYCAGGMCPVGRMAADKAAQWGYTKVWVYEGGIKDWGASGMPIARGP